MFQIEMVRKSKRSIRSIIIQYNEHSLRFNGEADVRLEKTEKVTNAAYANLFDCFNEYIDRYYDQDQKLALYKLYEKAHKIAESPAQRDYSVELNEIKPIVTAIIEFIDPERYERFVHNSRFMVIPPELSQASSKGYYPEETTITDMDYVELVKMLFVVRTIFPIVFSLTYRFSDRMGKNYSEFACGALINDNPWIINTYGWRKLQTYVSYAFNKRGLPQRVDAVGSMEYFVDHVLYNTVFSRLCCSVIPETEAGKNIATGINAAVRQHESSGSMWRKKDDRYEGEEEKRSLYERYQVKEAVKSTDEEVEAEFFAMGLRDENDEERHIDRFLVPCIALGIKNDKMVEQVFDNLPPIWEFELAPHVVKLLQLTFSGDISIMIYWATDYTQLMAAVALAQVRLSEWGYVYLPSVLGSVDDPEGMRSVGDELKLSEADKEFLESICDIQSRNDEGRSFNEAIEDATNFLEGFGSGRWKSNLEYGVLHEPEIYKKVERGSLFSLEITPEIKNEFMRLIRQINE